VFDYLDYRAFLRDDYLDKKRRRGFSFRGFSRKAGLGSPNYLKLVMDGHRNLTEAMAKRFAVASGLSGDGADYFSELVRLAQARTTSARGEHYARLTGFRRYRKTRPLAAAEGLKRLKERIQRFRRELLELSTLETDPAQVIQVNCQLFPLSRAKHTPRRSR
jgi:hypothetical protein